MGVQAARSGWSAGDALRALCGCLIAIQILGQLRGLRAPDFLAVVSNINLISTAAIVLLWRLLVTADLRLLSAASFWPLYAGLTVVTVGACLAPRAAASLVVLICMGAILRFCKGARPLPHGVVPLLVALCFNLTAAPLIFHAFAPSLVGLDAQLVFGFKQLLGEQPVISGTAIRGESGFRVILVGACSSFNSLSLSLLAYLAFVVWRRRQMRWGDYLWLGPMALAMVAWNVMRLHLSSLDSASYAYWHGDPVGTGLLNLGMHALMGGLCMMGERIWAERR